MVIFKTISFQDIPFIPLLFQRDKKNKLNGPNDFTGDWHRHNLEILKIVWSQEGIPVGYISPARYHSASVGNHQMSAPVRGRVCSTVKSSSEQV